MCLMDSAKSKQPFRRGEGGREIDNVFARVEVWRWCGVVWITCTVLLVPMRRLFFFFFLSASRSLVEEEEDVVFLHDHELHF